jgi:hypothetical protein
MGLMLAVELVKGPAVARALRRIAQPHCPAHVRARFAGLGRRGERDTP